MSVTIKPIISSKYAASSLTAEYTVPSSTTTIIDKFTATNIDTTDQTVSVHLVPSGGSADNTNKIIDQKSVSTSETYDLTELKNHILEAGDFISVVAGAADKVVIRASGREDT